MTTIELKEPWIYRTPEKTIPYPAGTHEVFQYIADQAEAEGVISKEQSDGESKQPAKAGKARAADKSES